MSRIELRETAISVKTVMIGRTALKASHLMNLPILKPEEWLREWIFDLDDIALIGKIDSDVLTRTLHKRKVSINTKSYLIEAGILVHFDDQLFLSWLSHYTNEDYCGVTRNGQLIHQDLSDEYRQHMQVIQQRHGSILSELPFVFI